MERRIINSCTQYLKHPVDNEKIIYHRNHDLPACIFFERSLYFMKDNVNHRRGNKFLLPAVLSKYGYKEYLLDGKLLSIMSAHGEKN